MLDNRGLLGKVNPGVRSLVITQATKRKDVLQVYYRERIASASALNLGLIRFNMLELEPGVAATI